MTGGETLSVERAGEKGGGGERRGFRRLLPTSERRAADGDCISECVICSPGREGAVGEVGRRRER